MAFIQLRPENKRKISEVGLCLSPARQGESFPYIERSGTQRQRLSWRRNLEKSTEISRIVSDDGFDNGIPLN